MTDDIKTDYYQFRANETASPGSDLVCAALGLCGEAGEVADIIKKWQYHSHALDKDALIKELGDCAWYLALACTKLDVKMSDVMQQNLDKLAGRYKGGAFTAAESINRPEYLSAPPSGDPTCFTPPVFGVTTFTPTPFWPSPGAASVMVPSIYRTSTADVPTPPVITPTNFIDPPVGTASVPIPGYIGKTMTFAPAPPEKKECSPECVCRTPCAESAQPLLTRRYDHDTDRYGYYREAPDGDWGPPLCEWEAEPFFRAPPYTPKVDKGLISPTDSSSGHVGIFDRDDEFLHVDLSSEGISTKPGDDEWVYDFYAGTWLHYVYRTDDAWELAGEYVDIESARKAAAKKRSLLSRIFRRS